MSTRTLLSFFLLVPFYTFAATLWALVVTDTFNDDIASSVISDRERVYTEVDKIAHYTHLNVKKLYLTGSKATPRNVLNQIKAINPSEDDVVMFYFSGHGYRSGKKPESDPWPNIYFVVTNQGMDFTRIVHQLQRKSQRLTIGLADACNSFMPDEDEPILVRKRGLFGKSAVTDRENYRHLFLDTKGSIIATSSVAGTYSLSLPSGGLFTTEFFHSLSDAIESPEPPQWDAIFDLSAAYLDELQTPYWEVLLR
ncbi:MAG: hypothetical protein KDK65_06740 [Chlamydiia bacterium]|nr:hypothetical protein [Chlamydiia bacterium]